jgi:hypothetical protein
MITYQIGIAEDVLCKASHTHITDAHRNRYHYLAASMTLESSLFVYDKDDLLFVLPFGPMWGRWYDKKWKLFGGYSNSDFFPDFCDVVERYCLRKINRASRTLFGSPGTSGTLETV